MNWQFILSCLYFFLPAYIFYRYLKTLGQIASGDTQSALVVKKSLSPAAAISRRALLSLKENSNYFWGSAAKCHPQQLPSG